MIHGTKTTHRFSAQSFLTQPGPGKTFKSWPPKHTVFSQGDKADTVYYLHDGKVKLTVVSSQGKEAVVGVLGAQQFFGEHCLTGQTVRTTTATVLEEHEAYGLLGPRWSRFSERKCLQRTIYEVPLVSQSAYRRRFSGSTV